MAKVTRLDVIPKLKGKTRVAAYARVSSDDENPRHSLAAQVGYYTEIIKANPEWDFAGVFSDFGITGTSTKKRKAFNDLINKCDEGDVDIILVKSISRFARNTVDTLESVRHLKDIGVEVRFEREGISSLSADGELMLTLLASFAQAEAEGTSENLKWTAKKHFEAGEPFSPVDCFGYDWDKATRSLTVNREEAKWVGYIYSEYLADVPIREITRRLASLGVKGRSGEALGRTTVKRILTSRTYTGDLILQKYYNPKIKQYKPNRGELAMYEVLDDHEPIIGRDVFDAVQEKLKNADHGKPRKYAGLMRCGECGAACENNHTGCHTLIRCRQCDLIPMRIEELDAYLDGYEGNFIIFNDRIEAGDNTIKRHVPDHFASQFSYIMRCGVCGSAMSRNKRYGIKWRCYDKDHGGDCTNTQITEAELLKASDQLFGDGIKFMSKVRQVLVYPDRVEFILRKGGEVTWQRE